MIKKYRSMSLPTELLNRVDSVVKANKFGYSTKTEFVREAIRGSLKELGALNIKYELK